MVVLGNGIEAKEQIVVVVPTYNEVESLPELVQRLFTLDIPTLQLIIVDDASPDGTGILAEELATQYPQRISVLHRPGKKGLGPAYISGFRHALQSGAHVIIQMDADLSHAPEALPLLLEALAQADVVVGSRYVSGGGIDRRWSRIRRLLSRAGNLYARWATGLRLRDVTSGFKVFRRRVLEELELNSLKCKGFAFQAEVNHLCQRRGYWIVEYPIFFSRRASGISKFSWRIIWEALWRLPALRWGGGATASHQGTTRGLSPFR